MADVTPISSDESISSVFDKHLESYEEILNSKLESSSSEFQTLVRNTVDGLELLKRQLNELNLFSSNEDAKELPTNSLKMMLVPALIAFSQQKLSSKNRKETLQLTLTNFKEYLSLCNDYNLLPNGAKNYSRYFEAVQVKKNHNDDRMEKIQRFKDLKEISEKLKIMKQMKSRSWDEDQQREFYLNLIEYNCLESITELKSINEELQLLAFQESREKNGTQVEEIPRPKPKFQGPVVLTKDAVQKQVFGQGYPSLPVMTVNEFYEQRVKEGIFPGPSAGSNVAPVISNNQENGEEEPENIESLRARDEWRDTHRTGWGNTYNRS